MVKEAKLPKRAHPCPHCLTSSYLTRHIDAVHLKLREHKCPYCVAFREKSHLTGTHTNHVHKKIPRRPAKAAK